MALQDERGQIGPREIIKRISDAAIELAFVRHDLTSDEVDVDEGATVKDRVAANEEFAERVKEDVLNCLTGDDFSCLDPEELDESNCELLWLQSILHQPEASGWTDDFPQVEETFYWIRHKQNHADINVGLLRDRTLLLCEGVSMSKSLRKDCEFLPASPSDFEQLVRLKLAAEVMDAAARFALMTPGFIRGRDQLLAAADALREVLDTELAQRKKEGL